MKKNEKTKLAVILVLILTITLPSLAKPPKVINASPDNGETNVSPFTKELVIHFDQPMDTQHGYSICGGGDNYPQTIGKPKWKDNQTLVMKIRLQPNHKYQLSINCRSYKNCRGQNGEPAEVYPITFQTGSAKSASKSRSSKSIISKLHKAVYAEETEGDLDKAIDLYEQVIQEADEVERIAAKAAYKLACCYLKKGDKDSAIDYFQSVVKNYPSQTTYTNQAKQQLKELGATDPNIITQQMHQTIDPDGLIHFKSPNVINNNGSTPITTRRFVNSDFVKLTKMYDENNVPVPFETTHEGNIYRYVVTFDKPIMPGESFTYYDEGTVEGLVKPVFGKKNEFRYHMVHSPATGQPVLRIETYLLPEGAELISKLPDIEQSTENGRIKLSVKKIVPANESIKTEFQYRLKTQQGTNPQTKSDLQKKIDSAKSGDTITIPKGIYSEPISINTPLTLKGQSKTDCIFEVTSDSPAIFVDTRGKGKVTIEGISIKWQLATSNKNEMPCALAVKDSNTQINNCKFDALGDFKRSPIAINIKGFSSTIIDSSQFEGFDYVVCFGEGTKGKLQSSIIQNCKSQGIILYSGANVDIIGNIITGSKKHAVRSTGGTLKMEDNLLINNANRGVYLGNKSAAGTIKNNVIIASGTGIGGFARSRVTIENNVISDSTYAAIGFKDSCQLQIRNNIFTNNERGWIMFEDGNRNGNGCQRNTFWKNKTDVENFRKTANSILENPNFVDAENGDFSLKQGPAKQNNQGLTNPQIIKQLWQKYKNPEIETTQQNKIQHEAQKITIAVNTAENWLNMMDNGNYNQSWETAAPFFKSAVTKPQWQTAAKVVRSPLGKFISRQVATKTYTKQVPGAPDGEYVIITFKASYENKKDAIETVTPMLDNDGKWKVSGYYIK